MMAFANQIGKPLAGTRRAAEEFLTAELRKAVPPGWQLVTLEDPGMPPGAVPVSCWEVRKADLPLESYGIRLSAGLDLVCFLYGNTDVGPGNLDQHLQPARVIEAWLLHRYGVRACLQHIMAHCEPNRYGYT